MHAVMHHATIAKEANELCEEADVIIVKAAPYFSMDTLVHRYKHAHFVQSSCYIKLFLQAKVVCQVRVKVCQIGLPCTRWQEDDLPLFGRVEDILTINDNVLFSVVKYKTLGIVHHFHSYSIRKTTFLDICWLSELIDYHP